MKDTKLQGAKILNDTLCRVGGHAFIWTSDGTTPPVPHDKQIRCNCGIYSWESWEKEQEAK